MRMEVSEDTRSFKIDELEKKILVQKEEISLLREVNHMQLEDYRWYSPWYASDSNDSGDSEVISTQPTTMNTPHQEQQEPGYE